MMEIILAFILLAAAFMALALPLYNARPRAFMARTGALNDLYAQRDGIYATLRDLDLDYQLGKLDGTDYQVLREKYLARAALLLERLDTLHGADPAHRDLSAEIEREVAALRRRMPEPRTQHMDRRKPSPGPQRSAAEKRPAAPSCPICGRAYAAGDRYCAKCGQVLS